MPPPVPSLNWVLIAGQDEHRPVVPRRASLLINNVYGMLRAVERGLGVASLPDYLCSGSSHAVRVLPHLEGPTFDAYFVYPEEMRASKRVGVFRDFLLRKLAETAGVVERPQSCKNAWQPCDQALVEPGSSVYIVHCSKEMRLQILAAAGSGSIPEEQGTVCFRRDA